MRIVGSISNQVIEILGLEIAADTPIYLGDTNMEHMKSRHPYEFDKYFDDIENIIAMPSYIGLNPKDGSLLYVKEYEVNSEYIRVAVKITAHGKCFAKTLHLLSTCNAERYIAKGTLKKLDTNHN